MELKIGDVLWQMQGREQNGICKWRAVPHSIEVIDDRKILFENGCGGSRNSIENHWFLTRQEAIDDFLKKHDSLEIPLPEVTEEEKDVITHLPRTDFQNLEVTKFDTVNTASVYLGYLDNLISINDRMKWRTEDWGEIGDIEILTLSEIWEQVRNIFSNERIVTVIVDSPFHGEIYVCGNHEEGIWEKIGETRGYA